MTVRRANSGSGALSQQSRSPRRSVLVALELLAPQRQPRLRGQLAEFNAPVVAGFGNEFDCALLRSVNLLVGRIRARYRVRKYEPEFPIITESPTEE